MRLHGGASELEWVVSAYMLAFAAFLIPAGSSPSPSRIAVPGR
jgi:hypothetical protein